MNEFFSLSLLLIIMKNNIYCKESPVKPFNSVMTKVWRQQTGARPYFIVCLYKKYLFNYIKSSLTKRKRNENNSIPFWTLSDKVLLCLRAPVVVVVDDDDDVHKTVNHLHDSTRPKSWFRRRKRKNGDSTRWYFYTRKNRLNQQLSKQNVSHCQTTNDAQWIGTDIAEQERGNTPKGLIFNYNLACNSWIIYFFLLFFSCVL